MKTETRVIKKGSERLYGKCTTCKKEGKCFNGDILNNFLMCYDCLNVKDLEFIEVYKNTKIVFKKVG